ncbi:MAG: tetratricopeptide repeat protein, partial [Thermoguttaceae bacterium]|jgi:tetratricopeptide (TPR) repeat protein
MEKILGPSAGRDRPIREISAVEQAAMIYYNRGIDLLAEKRFAAAVAATAKAVRLDPSNATARGNLLAALNNWAVDLGTARHYAEAARLLRQGLAIDPHYATFADNYARIQRDWIRALESAGHGEEAARVVRQSLAP